MTANVHVIVGSGAVGSQTARLLLARGERVSVVTRSGSGPDLPGVTRVRADASDAAALVDICRSATTIYNCANPSYHRWTRDWPPIAAALLAAAQSADAVLATVSNLYGYGPVAAPMTEDTPLAATSHKGRVRAAMWEDALAAHQAGRLRATEVRASDYLGAGSQSQMGKQVVPRILRGRPVRLLGPTDQPHSWTYVGDVARLLVTVGSDERAWGRPWHVPSNAPRTQHEVVDDLARAAGVPPVKVSTIPPAVLGVVGWFSPVVRELPEVAYQMRQPFVLDSSRAQQTFGLAPTPWADVMAEVVSAWSPAPAAVLPAPPTSPSHG